MREVNLLQEMIAGGLRVININNRIILERVYQLEIILALLR